MQGPQGFLPTFRQQRSLPSAGSWHMINLGPGAISDAGDQARPSSSVLP
jgi:hypothetical protein